MARHFFHELGSTATKSFALTDAPPILASGQGARLTDTAGRHYTDLASGSSTAVLGYGHPKLVAAISAQLATGVTHAGPHFHVPAQEAFCRALLARAPAHLTRLHPATNGTEAVEVALKAAQVATGRRHFIAFHGGYHGRTAGALAVSTTRTTRAALAPLLSSATFLPYPDSEASCEAAIAALAATTEDPASGLPPVAGVIIEAVQGTGGARVPPDRFLHAVASAAKRLGAVLILDEVFTGFGRTGTWFAFTRAGLEPDLVVLAKAMGGGTPGGAVLGREALLMGWPAGLQSSTFQLSPLAAAAGAAMIAAIEEEGLLARANEIGARIAAWAAGLPAGARCRRHGLGALHALAVLGRDGHAPDAARALAIRRRALDAGVITYECGTHGHAIGILPPLVIGFDALDEALEALARAVQAEA